MTNLRTLALAEDRVTVRAYLLLVTNGASLDESFEAFGTGSTSSTSSARTASCASRGSCSCSTVRFERAAGDDRLAEDVMPLGHLLLRSARRAPEHEALVSATNG